LEYRSWQYLARAAGAAKVWQYPAMAYEKTTRLYVESDLAPGATLALPAPQAHYLTTVLRMKPGDPLALFNGRDGEFAARIEMVGRGKAAVKLGVQRRTQRNEGDLWLLFAPVKRARIDYLVEKSVELGVSQIHPVMTARTVASRVNLARLKANMIEAAEQSERLSVPMLHPLRKLATALADWPAGRSLVLADETGGAPPTYEALGFLPTGPCAVLIGPEGGFADSELDALKKLAFVLPVGLGPRVLRADTAALAALSVIQAVAGDWRRPRG
jgi:16S rRNA (uracil1498-N3)-methyltransferase